MKPKQETNINNHYDYDLANNFNELAGGINQEWVSILEKLGQRSIEYLDPYGKSMEDILCDLIKLRRLDCPEKLDPLNSTDIDVGLHAHFIQRLSFQTIEKRLRYKRFMEKYKTPVKFYPPDYDNFQKHMRDRELNGAGYNALSHEKKTMLMFARAFDLEEKFKKYKLPRAPDKSVNYDVPFPYDVVKFSTFQYFPNIKCYNNKLFQTMHFHNFMVGFRAPSEMALMKVDYVHIDGKGNGKLSYPQPKRHGTIRNVILQKSVLSSKNHKSFKNYIDNIRPKVENQYSRDFLYLQEDGKPFTIRHLGKKLSETGKLVYPGFHPYMGRHWCCIAKLIETKVNTKHFDYLYINRWIGHKNIQTTMDYVAPAVEYYNIFPKNWYSHALKRYNGGKHDFPNRTQFSALLGNCAPVKTDGPEEI